MTDEELKSEVNKLTEAVREFSAVMLSKLIKKAKDGYGGWDSEYYLDDIKLSFLDHASRVHCGSIRQSIDVANLAMFIWYQNKHKHENAIEGKYDCIK